MYEAFESRKLRALFFLIGYIFADWKWEDSHYFSLVTVLAYWIEANFNQNLPEVIREAILILISRKRFQPIDIALSKRVAKLNNPQPIFLR